VTVVLDSFQVGSLVRLLSSTEDGVTLWEGDHKSVWMRPDNDVAIQILPVSDDGRIPAPGRDPLASAADVVE
jgi:hypothetical protein